MKKIASILILASFMLAFAACDVAKTDNNGESIATESSTFTSVAVEEIQTTEETTTEAVTTKEITAEETTAEGSTAEKSTTVEITTVEITTEEITTEETTAEETTAEEITTEEITAEEATTEAVITEETTTEEATTEEATTEETTESPYLAPDFTVYDYEGNAVKLSDFRGKPIVLNFWARNCIYCTMEMPDFQAAYEKYGEDVVFLMVCFTSFSNKGVEYERAYVDENGYTFPVYYDTEDSAVRKYGINSIPQTFFINSKFDLYTYIPGMASAELLEQCIGYILE